MKIEWTENIKMALVAVFTNKLRSFLTLVGIVAGVASIIAVMTGIEILKTRLEKDMSQLGTNTFQVQKWPAMGGGSNWRKIMKRKPLTIENAALIRERVAGAELVGSELWDQAVSIAHEDIRTNPNVSLAGATPEFQYNNNQMVSMGRFITEEDVKVGRKVIVLGMKVVNKLFPFKDPLDQVVRIGGQKYTVIGVFEELGDLTIGGSRDNVACIPISAFIQQFGLKDNRGFDRSVNITVKVRDGFMMENVMEEVRGVMRLARNVRPLDEDDFDIYSNDSLIRTFGDMTIIIRLVAIIMGAIALLVAGIGIMNIMLVSVTERTKEIGIRKAIGAKRRDILTQFLIEAIVLCQIGGFIGIGIGVALGNIVSALLDVNVTIPWGWAFGGLIFCSIIGIVFGMWPASKASKLDPIESLRYE